MQNGLALVDRNGVEKGRHARAARSGEACGGTFASVGEHKLHGTLIVRVWLASQPAAFDQHVGEATDDAAIQAQAPGHLGLGERLRSELGERVGLRNANRLSAWCALGLVQTKRPHERHHALFEGIGR